VLLVDVKIRKEVIRNHCSSNVKTTRFSIVTAEMADSSLIAEAAPVAIVWFWTCIAPSS
jgi:hypothetical protein